MAASTSRMSLGPPRLTPRGSPSAFAKSINARSPDTTLPEEQCLVLKRANGHTINGHSGFDCLESHHCYAYVAGACAILVRADGALKTTQKCYRITPLSHSNTFNAGSDSPLGNPASRARPSALSREIFFTGSPSASPQYAAGDSSNRATAGRERVKATTCVSLSPDGNLLAVGEVIGFPRNALIVS